jgi:anti-anti-sigma regulatory factor
MLKITRMTDAAKTRVIVSGRIGAAQLPELRRFVEEEHASNVVLDLTEVTLVDVDVVRFLSVCESQGVRLLGCPGYVREWMAREKKPA